MIQFNNDFLTMINKIYDDNSLMSGNRYEAIMEELAEFVEEELEGYDEKLRSKIKGSRLHYKNKKLTASANWLSSRTLSRNMKNQRCSEELFNVVGYYTYGKEWLQHKKRYLVSNEKKDVSNLKMSQILPLDTKHEEKTMTFVSLLDERFYLEIHRDDADEKQSALYDKLKESLEDNEQTGKENDQLLRDLLNKILKDTAAIKQDIKEMRQELKRVKVQNVPKKDRFLLLWVILLSKKGSILETVPANKAVLSTADVVALHDNDNFPETGILESTLSNVWHFFKNIF